MFKINENQDIMSEEKLRSYRLTSMEEPTDEMLQAIMEQVAESARESSRRVEDFKRKMMERTRANIEKSLAV